MLLHWRQRQSFCYVQNKDIGNNVNVYFAQTRFYADTIFFQVNIKICSYGICRSDSGIAVELSYNYCNSSQNHKEEPPPQPPHQSLSVWSLCPMYTALWCRVLSDILTAGIKVECLSRFQSAIHIRQYLDRQDNQWGSFQENRLQAIFSQTEIYLPTSGTCKQNPFIQNSANSTAWCAGERDTTHWKAVAQAQRCHEKRFKRLEYWTYHQDFSL